MSSLNLVSEAPGVSFHGLNPCSHRKRAEVTCTDIIAFSALSALRLCLRK